MEIKYENYVKSADYLRELHPGDVDTAVILGSGLGGFADELEDKITVHYKDIPAFPVSTVENHKGELIFGKAGNKEILVMNGRFHYYEGYDMRTTAYPIGVMKLLGVKNLIITNASGGINRTYTPGDLVCVRDHIKLAAESPVRGSNIPEFGSRFFDMGSVYSAELINKAKECAAGQGFELKEGVYAYMSGPQYETPAEIRMLGILGADLVGMSTVAEVIAAAHCKINVLCISCVSNYAAGITGEPLSHEEVCEVGAAAAGRLKGLLSGVIAGL